MKHIGENHIPYDGALSDAAAWSATEANVPPEGIEEIRHSYKHLERTIVQMQELLRANEESGKLLSDHIVIVQEALRGAAPDDPLRDVLVAHIEEWLAKIEKIQSDHAEVEKNMQDLLAIPLPDMVSPEAPSLRLH
ncbi:MAG: hypothetical protein KBD21_02100 [Candidatus Pacebacteria bacterium]|nr:hypothetical protein [Candidatus Paceibacterota bacterium]